MRMCAGVLSAAGVCQMFADNTTRCCMNVLMAVGASKQCGGVWGVRAQLHSCATVGRVRAACPHHPPVCRAGKS